MKTINSSYARIILRHFDGEGHRPEDFLQGAEIGLEEVFQNDEIPLRCFRAILENAERLGPRTPVGFTIGRHYTTLAMGPLGVALGCAPTLRDGLRSVEQFTRLHATYVTTSLESELNNITLRFDMQGLTGVALRHHVEATIMFLEWYVQTITGKPPEGITADVVYAPPEYADQYSQYLASKVCFSSNSNAIRVPAKWLDVRSLYHNVELWAQSQQTLSKKLLATRDADENLVEQHVRAYLVSHVPPLPRLTDAAKQLHISERTLNRRLQKEGTSFRALRGEITDLWARRHLVETTASVESIAAALGYEDTANFRRAFKRQHGMTPVQFRDGLSGGGAVDSSKTNKTDKQCCAQKLRVSSP